MDFIRQARPGLHGGTMVALATGMGTRMVRACCSTLPPEAREKGTLPPSKVGVLETKAKMHYVFHFIPMDGHSIQFQEFNVFRVCLSLRSSWHCPICIFKETVSSHGGFIEVTGFEWVLEALRCFDVFGWRIVHCRMFRAHEEVSPKKCRRGKQQKTAIWNATHFGMFRNHVVTTVHGQYRAVGQPKVSQITREAFNKVVGALQGSYFMNGFHWVAASNRAGFLVQALLSWIRP